MEPRCQIHSLMLVLEVRGLPRGLSWLFYRGLFTYFPESSGGGGIAGPQLLQDLAFDGNGGYPTVCNVYVAKI